MSDRLLTAQQVADLLGVHRNTLRNWEKRGEGPPMLRLCGGRVIRYDPEALAEWLGCGSDREREACYETCDR